MSVTSIKSTRFMCDRCFREKDLHGDDNYPVNWGAVVFANGWRSQSSIAPSGANHLCDDCCSDFKEWFKQEQTDAKLLVVERTELKAPSAE